MALGTFSEKSAEQNPQTIEKTYVDIKEQQEILPPPKTTKSSFGETQVNAQSGSLFKAAVQAIEKIDVDNKEQQETLTPPETTKSLSSENHVYAQKGGVFKATKNVGTVKMNSTFEQGSSSKQAPTVPDGVTHYYANDAPVVESETIQNLDFTSTYK